jgi:hypothetical protein
VVDIVSLIEIAVYGPNIVGSTIPSNNFKNKIVFYIDTVYSTDILKHRF